MPNNLIVPSKDKQLSTRDMETAIEVVTAQAYELIQKMGEDGDIGGLAGIEDKLSVLDTLARKEKVSNQAQNKVAEAKLRTQRMAGEVWIALPRTKDGKIDRALLSGMSAIPRSGGRGSNQDFSWNNRVDVWRRVVGPPENLFEAHIKDETKTNGNELTTKGYIKEVYKPWRQRQKAKERAKTVAKMDSNVWCGMFQNYAEKIGENKVDLIFTDPPYDVSAIDLYADLSAFAAYVLRPGGICMAYAGQFTLPDALVNLGQNLEYMWVAGIRHTGGELRFRKYHIRNAWKPILVFYKAPLECWWDWFSDMIEGGGKEKEFHKWGQALSEALYYIRAASPKGGVVVDPMCGGGTSLVAAKGLGMKYIGIDVDKEAVTKTQEALSAVEPKQFLK